MHRPSLGLITAVHNRTEHLVMSAALLSRSPLHREHLIVDWSSSPAVQRSQLPRDPRIRLVRVEGERLWWHSRAYNLAIKRSSSDWILRCDADCLLHPAFFAALRFKAHTVQVATLPGGLHCETRYDHFGLIAASRTSLAAVGGYEPLLVGWGFEDTDLLERLFLSGQAVSLLPSTGIEFLKHSDRLRQGQSKPRRSWLPPRMALEASHAANRAMARWCRGNHNRTGFDDPGPTCIGALPLQQRQLRQRSLLAGALAALAGRHGRWFAGQLPPWLIHRAVKHLALDPLAC